MLKAKSLCKITSALSLSALLSISCFSIPAEAAFWNLSGDIYSHDPTIIKQDDLWWSPYTGTGLPMKYSNDGIKWTEGTPIFSSELSWWRTYAPKMDDNNVWAPDIKYYNGRYWMFYCVSEFGTNNSAIGLESCTSILKGDWRDDGMVISSSSGSDKFNAIDPNLTFDSSGQPYLAFGSWFDGIHIVKLNKNSMKPTGSISKIAYKSGGIEGANIVYNNGYYYLFCSYGVCCKGVNSTYKIGCGRATKITGPYYDKKGNKMTNGAYTLFDGGNDKWVGPGGQSIYKNGHSWLIARHAYDAENNGVGTLLINDLNFDSDGWPVY